MMLLAEQIRAKRLRKRTLRNAGIAELNFRPEEDFLSFYDALAESKGKAWKNIRDHLLGKQLTKNTIASYLDVLKTALNIAVKQRIISVNPFVYVDAVRRQRTLREYLTVDELSALVATPCQDQEVRRAFLFACLTGLRIRDLRALRWSNVRPDSVHFTQKKTGDITEIPLAGQAHALIGERGRKKSTDCVFALSFGDDVFNNRLLRWVKAAGIEKHITSHSARHTFATMLITQGNDLYSVQHLLGHRDIKVTQVYAKLVDERKSKAINSLPALGL